MGHVMNSDGQSKVPASLLLSAEPRNLHYLRNMSNYQCDGDFPFRYTAHSNYPPINRNDMTGLCETNANSFDTFTEGCTPSSVPYNLNNLQLYMNGNYDPQQTNPSSTRNVHFSPVVSQLQYIPTRLREDRQISFQKPNNGPSEHLEMLEKEPIRVKVQVQQIEPPSQKRVERIQASPSHNGEEIEQTLNKLVLDFDDLLIKNSMTSSSKQEGRKGHSELFANTVSKVVDEETMRQSGPYHATKEWNNGRAHSLLSSEKENFAKYVVKSDGKSWTRPSSAAIPKEEIPAGTNLKRNHDILNTETMTEHRMCMMSVLNSEMRTLPGNAEEPDNIVQCVQSIPRKVPYSSSSTLPTDCRLENTFPAVTAPPESCGDPEQESVRRNLNSGRKSIHSTNLGSLECLDVVEGKHGNFNGDPDVIDGVGESDKTLKSKNNSKGHSWPNAYRKFKEKSKPKLSFLHRITFGRFGNNSGKSGKEEISNSSCSSKIKKSHEKKRSSCPPLGHPLLLAKPTKILSDRYSCDGIEENLLLNCFNDDSLRPTETESRKECFNDRKTNKPAEVEEICKLEKTEALNFQSQGIADDSKNRKEEVPTLLKGADNDPHEFMSIKTPSSSDLPPKPSPRQRKLSQASTNSSGYSSITRRITQLSLHNDTSDADELSLTFERIMEAISDIEFDAISNSAERRRSSPLPEDANSLCSSSAQQEEYDPEHVLGQSAIGLPGNCKILPVIGKPPIPPLSANRLSGMRTGVSERLSFLRGRMSATATTESRLAMELAAKLCEFREELHRSREEIANSRPNLDEIENSVRISMAIDRTERTLPQSRNSTRVSLPPMPPLLPYNSNNGSAALGASPFTISSCSTCISGTSPQEQDQPVKPITEIINEEWERVVLRAKENFSKSSHYRHYYSNNGRSADPLQSRGIVLETDLDSGASLGYPAESNYIIQGDGVHNEALEKVLNVEDVAALGPFYFVQRNSCSLQNLSSCGVIPALTMATLTPGDPGGGNGKEDRSRSMEFLLDSEKNAHLRPPENTLMKNQDTRRMSEHELRVQRSLQKLNVPDWYKNYTPSNSAAGTPSKSRDFGSGSGLAGGWPGLSTSKTSSLTSLQSAGRYAGSKTAFGYGRHRATGTASAGGRSSRDSLMSPSSTASASPSPNFERSSFTYGMPYALTRFATTRMSCGASPASLSPSPSPVGGIGTSTSTPVSAGPNARYGYQKQPYLGWRSQERLASKTLYRSPAERLAADLIAQKVKPPPTATIVVEQPPPPEVEVKESSPKKEIASSDLSLNNSEESNSHKLNRVRSSIKEVSNAIVDYVNESKPLDDGMNGRASPRRGLVWLESSFVGTKPIDSPGTPDTPSTFMSHRGSRKDTAFKFDDPSMTERTKDGEAKSGESSSTSHYASYVSRNEQMEERSNSSSVSSPTLEDILDSLLALRRPNKKFRSRGKGHENPSKTAEAAGVEDEFHYTLTTSAPSSSEPRPSAHSRQQPASPYHQYDYEPSTTSEIYSTAITSSTKIRHHYQDPTPPTSASDWQDRLNQPLADSTFTYGEPETFTLTGTIRKSGAAASGALITSSNSSSNNNFSSYDKTQADRYSASAIGTPGLNESVTCSSSSSANVIHSASSSLHSTPTHQQYQYKQQQHNQSSAMASSSSAASKDYYCSSTSSSPAKSCLVDTTHHRDENELRLRSGATGAGVDEEELAFGNPTEIRSTVTTSSVAPMTGGVIVNPLTGLSEYSNPPTPARHRRVSFDLDFSDKEEKSSSRSRNKDENVGGTIQCRNTKCGKTATGLEARREFKVCHNCNAYYCSRECRRAHWEKHKKTCMQSRVGAICKQIISHVKEDSYVMNQLSTVAKRGFLAKGRGCVKLFFNSADRAERFLTGGLPELPEPLYIPHSDMLPEEMGAQTFSELSDQCRSYNPETRFVLYACVCVVNEVPTYGAVKWERELISRSSKLRLLLPRNFYEETQRLHHPPANPAHLMSALQDPSSGQTSPAAPGLQAQQPNVPLYDSVAPSNTSGDDFPPPPLPPHHNTVTTTTSSDNDTLILRSVPPPSSHQLNSKEHKRLREVSFTNIQKHLLLRGVDLKRTYPDIYTKLCKYVEHDEPFLPVTIYPKNKETGRQFVCVIMPESSDSAYSAAAEESVQRHPLQRVETINISEPDDDEVMDLT